LSKDYFPQGCLLYVQYEHLRWFIAIPADRNAHQLLQSEDVHSIGKHDQAEPRGLQYIELPALQVDRGEILIPN
jgi:hypothetical protein